MAGTSSKSEKFEMRVPIEELADWRRRATAMSVSVAELIRLKMRRPDEPLDAVATTPVPPPPFSRGRGSTVYVPRAPVSASPKAIASLNLPAMTDFPKRDTRLRGEK